MLVPEPMLLLGKVKHFQARCVSRAPATHPSGWVAMAPGALPPVLVTAAAMALVLLDEGVQHGAVREVLSFPLWS